MNTPETIDDCRRMARIVVKRLEIRTLGVYPRLTLDSGQRSYPIRLKIVVVVSRCSFDYSKGHRRLSRNHKDCSDAAGDSDSRNNSETHARQRREQLHMRAENRCCCAEFALLLRRPSTIVVEG
jgi:hypothetical protein